MFYIISALILYSVAIITGAAASRNANPTLTTGIMNTLSAIIPFAILAKSIKPSLEASSKFGIIMALVTGVFLALFSVVLNRAYTTDKVAIISPVVFGGAIALSSIASFFIFKERITALQSFGLILVLAGVAIIVCSKLKLA